MGKVIVKNSVAIECLERSIALLEDGSNDYICDTILHSVSHVISDKLRLDVAPMTRKLLTFLHDNKPTEDNEFSEFYQYPHFDKTPDAEGWWGWNMFLECTFWRDVIIPEKLRYLKALIKSIDPKGRDIFE